jgi:hypothetical protein
MTRSRRLAAVDTFVFPAGVRFALDLDTAQFAVAETAARQWFRLAARHPKATMSMPSAVVDKLWLALTRHERDYQELTRAVVGRDFPYSATTGTLAATYRFARADEPGGMPLLFRIDKQLGVTGGRHYIADCGGRGECFPVRGATCLQHLTGVGKATKWGFTKSSDVNPGAICGAG